MNESENLISQKTGSLSGKTPFLLEVAAAVSAAVQLVTVARDTRIACAAYLCSSLQSSVRNLPSPIPLII